MTTRAPKVSVIMAAYNHAPYIKEAIESALAQTWRGFELIVVDDGSTDATPQIVRQFGSPVRYIHQQNRGQGAARNRGIASARGEFICFLDDDDLWDAEYLATVMSFFQRQPDTDALYTGFRYIDAAGTLLPQTGTRVVPPHQMYDALVRGGWFPPLVATVRKKCLDEVGPLDETLRGHDDWDLWLRIARSYVFRGIPDVLARYRVHAGAMSADVEHMLQDKNEAIAKHFGSQDGSPLLWPPNRRRAFGASYRNGALGHMQLGHPTRGYQLLARAVSTDPLLLKQLSTFYQLALGAQSRGYRGKADLLDIEANAADMLCWLDTLFREPDRTLRAHRRAAYGNAFLALAMLSDQAGRWARARVYLLRAIRSRPTLLRDTKVVRRLLKLCAGQRVVGWLRHQRPGHAENNLMASE